MDSCPHCGGFRNRGSPFSEVPLYIRIHCTSMKLAMNSNKMAMNINKLALIATKPTSETYSRGV